MQRPAVRWSTMQPWHLAMYVVAGALTLHRLLIGRFHPRLDSAHQICPSIDNGTITNQSERPKKRVKKIYIHKHGDVNMERSKRGVRDGAMSSGVTKKANLRCDPLSFFFPSFPLLLRALKRGLLLRYGACDLYAS
ncbi:hypothetical protein NL676_020245 [Syzygium grande]|nr:hypothetical protein NL676_020245 [Syzygium grande]